MLGLPGGFLEQVEPGRREHKEIIYPPDYRNIGDNIKRTNCVDNAKYGKYRCPCGVGSLNFFHTITVSNTAPNVKTKPCPFRGQGFRVRYGFA